jgi:hypothetical protein
VSWSPRSAVVLLTKGLPIAREPILSAIRTSATLTGFRKQCTAGRSVFFLVPELRRKQGLP